MLKKIDIHVHSVLEKGTLRPDGGDFTTPDELRAMYDTLGIEKGVQLPTISPEGQYHTLTNEDARKLAALYPETYYWFCNIDPRGASNSPDMDWSYVLEQYKAWGARGVGEMVANMYFDDPMVLNVFKHCEKCELPVLFHIGQKGNDYGLIDELGLPRLEKVLGMFPKLTFIGHSQKFWAEISGDCTEELRGGYPTGRVIPGGRVPELLRKYPNLRGDMSAGSGCNAIMRDPAFGYAFIEEFQNQLFFGTDICDPRDITSFMLRLSHFLDEAVEKRYISETAYAKVCRMNALAILEK
ncbi:MAG: hypothetical protein GX929_09080 [Clostridiales bacterium]|nr:hypothetical protein [Clostridiales bacterium]